MPDRFDDWAANKWLEFLGTERGLEDGIALLREVVRDELQRLCDDNLESPWDAMGAIERRLQELSDG